LKETGITKRFFLVTFCVLLALLSPSALAGSTSPLVPPDYFRAYVEFFNSMTEESVVNFIPDARAWEWMRDNIQRFACPDHDVEQTYYYRWWAFRKHIKQTPAGFIITEFLKPVKHGGQYNAISCALGHHIAEARWLRQTEYLDQDLNFWLRSGQGGGIHPELHRYSGWTAWAVYQRWLVDARTDFLVSLLDSLLQDYEAWERERARPDGLFWQYDVRDGMEESISGSRKHKNARPTINSYMYGNARALAAIARLAGRSDLARTYDAKADRLRALVQQKLWHPEDRFFETLLENGRLAGVRELIGYTPWYFDLPQPGRGYEEAWRQLMDPRGFYAPFGPTTAEQRHPGFRIADQGDDCQWNGPSWPFSTTVTLKALANVLRNYPQRAITVKDYFETFLIYTRSHRLKLPDGRVIPWIDENLNPFTGEWQARSMKIRKGTFYGRGDHYNHSGYADLLITGVVGLVPRPDSVVEIHPLLPEGTWDWFCLEDVPYHGHSLTIIWDRTGQRFHRGPGLRVYADGAEIGRRPRLGRLTARLPAVRQ
jgi:hypothetical protein